MSDDENTESHYDRIKRLVALQLAEDPERFKVYLPSPETDDDRFVLERIYWMEDISSRLVAYVDPKKLEELFPAWSEAHRSGDIPDPLVLETGVDELPDPPDGLAEDGARRQHLKEQFLSGEPELSDIGAAYEAALRQDAGQAGGKTASAFDRITSADASKPVAPGKALSAFDALAARQAGQHPDTPTSAPEPEPNGPEIEP